MADRDYGNGVPDPNAKLLSYVERVNARREQSPLTRPAAIISHEGYMGTDAFDHLADSSCPTGDCAAILELGRQHPDGRAR